MVLQDPTHSMRLGTFDDLDLGPALSLTPMLHPSPKSARKHAKIPTVHLCVPAGTVQLFGPSSGRQVCLQRCPARHHQRVFELPAVACADDSQISRMRHMLR